MLFVLKYTLLKTEHLSRFYRDAHPNTSLVCNINITKVLDFLHFLLILTVTLSAKKVLIM